MLCGRYSSHSETPARNRRWHSRLRDTTAVLMALSGKNETETYPLDRKFLSLAALRLKVG
jgi:hypothetical protein